MKNHHDENVVCVDCGQSKPGKRTKPVDMLQPSLQEILTRRRPEWKGGGFICQECADRLRGEYMKDLLVKEKGEITALEQEVLDSLKAHEIVSENLNTEFDSQLTVGERVADRVATFGGSWRFIFIFGFVLAGWIALNSIHLLRHPFDPFPYILLNLVLSCLAAIQAPVIMMSQNRREDKDRLRSEHDYRVNLKAELEIRNLHAKLDELMKHQWQRLIEIQTMQLDLLEESHKKSKPGS